MNTGRPVTSQAVAPAVPLRECLLLRDPHRVAREGAASQPQGFGGVASTALWARKSRQDARFSGTPTSTACRGPGQPGVRPLVTDRLLPAQSTRHSDGGRPREARAEWHVVRAPEGHAQAPSPV